MELRFESPKKPQSDNPKSEIKLEFAGWLHKNTRFFLTQFIAVLGFVALLLEVVIHTEDLLKDKGLKEISDRVTAFIYVLQFVFVLIVIFFLNAKSFIQNFHVPRFIMYHKRLLNSNPNKQEIEATLKITQLNTTLFGKYWLSFWKWIFVLYVILFTRSILDGGYLHNAYYFVIANVAETFFNNFSMVNIFICFLIIQSPISALNYDKETLKSQFFGFLKKKGNAMLIVKGFSIVHLFVLFCMLILDYPNDKWQTAQDVNLMFKTLSGLFNCCSLALLIARLDSKIVNVPSTLISVLVVYAAVQPLFVFFNTDDHFFIVMIVSFFTLVFKVYFYLIVAYIINTGRLADLFMNFPMVKLMIEKGGYESKDYYDRSTSDSKKPDELIHNVDMINLLLENGTAKNREFNIQMAQLAALDK